MFRKETLIGLIVLTLVIIALVFIRSCSLDIEKANELKEIYAPCPTCYEPCYGINNEVVCRNEDCPAYGLPQEV